jgi:hypothetical protein
MLVMRKSTTGRNNIETCERKRKKGKEIRLTTAARNASTLSLF